MKEKLSHLNKNRNNTKKKSLRLNIIHEILKKFMILKQNTGFLRNNPKAYKTHKSLTLM